MAPPAGKGGVTAASGARRWPSPRVLVLVLVLVRVRVLVCVVGLPGWGR